MNATVQDHVTVSVIVLTYNHEKYVRQALDSILMQKTTFAYEILVGDDASTDGTAEILKEYQKKYPNIFRLFLREKNIGATKNSYELLTSAKGRYLATCEGDDYWTDPNKLQLQVDFLEKHPDYIGCAHRFMIVDDDGCRLSRQHLRWVRFRERFRLEDFQGLYLPSQPSTFVRRNLFLSSSEDYTVIYTANPMIADRTLILIFLCRGDFYTMDRVMSCYRQAHKGGSATTQLYNRNKPYIEMDQQLNERLEQYASQLLQREIVFEGRRQDLFVSTLAALVRHRDRRYLKLAGTMLAQTRNPMKMLLSLPICVVRKIVWRVNKN